MHYSPFDRQLDPDEIKARNDYSFEILDSKGHDDLEKAKAAVLKSHPELEGKSWFQSLHQEMHRQMTLTLESEKDPDSVTFPRSMFTNFMIAVDTEYCGVFSFAGMPLKRLEGLSNYDVSAPHMAWIRQIDEELSELESKHPSVSEDDLYSYITLLGDINIGIDKALEVMAKRTEMSYLSLDMRQWVEWYQKSDSKFDANGQVKFEEAKAMGSTLSVWSEGKTGGLNKDDLHWLYRNYEVHPMHRKAIEEWATKFMDIKNGDDLDASFNP